MPKPLEKPDIWIDGSRPWQLVQPQEKLIPGGRPTPIFRWMREELADFFVSQGLTRWRADQIYRWIYGKGVWSWKQMSDLSPKLHGQLSEWFSFELPRMRYFLKSSDGTTKFLFELSDGLTVESVLIPAEDRLTLCLSSEVGCNMACRFCFTGTQKLKRRLHTDEIVGQFLQVEKHIYPQKITNIVFMGMGEPLDNPESVFKAVHILHDSFGRNFSRRKITVSTSGLVPEIWRVTASQTRLAVSLNGYDDESRSFLMPINRRYPLDELLKACRTHVNFSGDRVTFEYVLIEGVTDQIEHGQRLVKLLRSIPCKINIIPFNEFPGSPFKRPSETAINRFQQYLIQQGFHVLRRQTRGRDIYAACGQLTHDFQNKPLYFQDLGLET